MGVGVVGLAIERPVFPPCAVDGRFRNIPPPPFPSYSSQAPSA